MRRRTRLVKFGGYPLPHALAAQTVGSRIIHDRLVPSAKSFSHRSDETSGGRVITISGDIRGDPDYVLRLEEIRVRADDVARALDLEDGSATINAKLGPVEALWDVERGLNTVASETAVTVWDDMNTDTEANWVQVTDPSHTFTGKVVVQNVYVRARHRYVSSSHRVYYYMKLADGTWREKNQLVGLRTEAIASYVLTIESLSTDYVKVRFDFTCATCTGVYRVELWRGCCCVRVSGAPFCSGGYWADHIGPTDIGFYGDKESLYWNTTPSGPDARTWVPKPWPNYWTWWFTTARNEFHMGVWDALSPSSIWGYGAYVPRNYGSESFRYAFFSFPTASLFTQAESCTLGPGVGTLNLYSDVALDSYTKLLLHMNGLPGSKIFKDETGKTVTAYGDAQIDAGEILFGGTTGLFGGTGYLSLVDSADWYLGTEDFTMEFLVEFDDLPPVSEAYAFFSQKVDATHYQVFWLYNWGGTYQWRYAVVDGSTLITHYTNTTPIIDTLYHIALVRSGTSFKTFVNGMQIGSTTTDADAIPDFGVAATIGVWGTSQYHHGRLKEFRFTKGFARWTSNFTPPTNMYQTPRDSASSVVLGAQDEYLQNDVLQGAATLPLGVYRAFIRWTDFANVAGDLKIEVLNVTDATTIASGTFSCASVLEFAYSYLEFNLDADDVGDTIRIKISKATATANTIYVDLMIILPICRNQDSDATQAFPEDFVTGKDQVFGPTLDYVPLGPIGYRATFYETS